jgi:hypothetical protein
MSTSATDVHDFRPPLAMGVSVTDDALVVKLDEGRTLSAPLQWYPRLAYGTPTERGIWRLIGHGEGIHWPELDDDISVEGLLAGRRSAESQRSPKAVAGGPAIRRARCLLLL